MRQAFRCVLVVLCLSVVAGCSVGHLNDVVLLSHGPTPDLCEPFESDSAYGAQNVRPLFKPLKGEPVSCSPQQDEKKYPALKLHVGDRIAFHQITFGQAIYDSSNFLDIRPPSDRTLTLVLRQIGDDGSLADEEELFLYAIQSVARAENYGDTPGSNGTMTKAIAEKLSDPDVRRSLWNKIPDALRLVNVESNEKEKNDRTRWQLTINMKELCSVFPDPVLFEMAFGSIAGVCKDDVFRPIDFGHRGFRHPAHAAAFFESQDAESRTYYDTLPVSGIFGFVNVEARGASMQTPGYPERNWSLKEWQMAGICNLGTTPAKPAIIRRLKLKGSWPASWMTVIYRNVSKIEATHSVQITNLPKEQLGPHRYLKKEKGGYPYLINSDDLDKLRLSDIAELEWGMVPKGDWRASKWSGTVTPQCIL